MTFSHLDMECYLVIWSVSQRFFIAFCMFCDILNKLSQKNSFEILLFGSYFIYSSVPTLQRYDNNFVRAWFLSICPQMETLIGPFEIYFEICFWSFWTWFFQVLMHKGKNQNTNLKKQTNSAPPPKKVL